MEIAEFATNMSTLTVLSAMITPVVLILATGQLILTTSQRLARSIERARKISDQFEELISKEASQVNQERKELLYKLLYRAANRSRKLQQTISLLYVALSVFVATSVTIGLLEVLGYRALWVPVALGLFGTVFLFYATILLVAETRVALGAVDLEMNYLIRNYSREMLTSSSKKESRIS
ncbi:DUF2721 domain-containing protein [Pontibacter qinzhouensis]|uniref:DUF2721 domain-containing protein n=1 Tax=Pontibacter qinzhouensis TaxID=2603253 RepID=A0A5C8K2S1_9BACT|nr:DUF2721 domain-containing protein [Pontibacter qinzhouensis]TXK44846.1 DUF2721 domain-containing protein [Pontibacter qinzhouensis]